MDSLRHNVGMPPIPWAAILTHGPSILSAARSLFATQSSKVNERHRSLEGRLDELEKTSVETARVVQQMAEQLQALTLAQEDLQRRLRMTLIIGSVAAALAVGAMIVAALS
jgi:dsDNA-specific endonuclease/ATPase MutS2